MEEVQIRFSIEDWAEPWFVPVLEQAEEIFGTHIFPYVLGPPYESKHFDTLVLVNKWFHNVLWGFKEYFDVNAEKLPWLYQRCRPKHFKHLLVDFIPLDEKKEGKEKAEKKGHEKASDSDESTQDSAEADGKKLEPKKPNNNETLLEVTRFSNLITLEVVNADLHWDKTFNTIMKFTNLQNLSLDSCFFTGSLRNETKQRAAPFLQQLAEFEFSAPPDFFEEGMYSGLRLLISLDDEVLEEHKYIGWMIDEVAKSTRLTALMLSNPPNKDVCENFLENKLTSLTTLTALHWGSEMTVEQFQSTSVLTNLGELVFSVDMGIELEETALEPLTTLKNLSSFSITVNEHQEENFLASLSHLTKLQTLMVFADGYASDGFWGLPLLTQLKDLEISYGQYAFDHFTLLTSLQYLEKLTLPMPDDSHEEFLQFLPHFTQLRKLSLLANVLPTLFMCPQVSALSDLPQLTKLELPSCECLYLGSLLENLKSTSEDPTKITELLSACSFHIPPPASSYVDRGLSGLLSFISSPISNQPAPSTNIEGDGQGICPLLRRLKKISFLDPIRSADKALLKLLFPQLEVLAVETDGDEEEELDDDDFGDLLDDYDEDEDEEYEYDETS